MKTPVGEEDIESLRELSIGKFENRDNWGHVARDENIADLRTRVYVRDDFDRWLGRANSLGGANQCN